MKLLITGQMRSGTTMISKFLNAHDNVKIYTDIFHPLVGQFPTNDGIYLYDVNYNKQLKYNEKEYILRSIKYGIEISSKNENRSVNEINLDINLFETMEQLYNTLLSSNSKSDIVGHKVTNGEFNLKSILNQTDIKVLYIYRDPRDVVNSYLKTDFNKDDDIEKISRSWYESMEYATENKDNPNFLMVSYEDLLLHNDNGDVKEKIENFLENNVELNMKFLNKNKIGTNTSYNKEDNPVFRWKTVGYDPRIANICKKYMKTYEYL